MINCVMFCNFHILFVVLFIRRFFWELFLSVGCLGRNILPIFAFKLKLNKDESFTDKW